MGKTNATQTAGRYVERERARRATRKALHALHPVLGDMDRAWRKTYRDAKAVREEKGAESRAGKIAWNKYLKTRQAYREHKAVLTGSQDEDGDDA